MPDMTTAQRLARRRGRDAENDVREQVYGLPRRYVNQPGADVELPTILAEVKFSARPPAALRHLLKLSRQNVENKACELVQVWNVEADPLHRRSILDRGTIMMSLRDYVERFDPKGGKE